MFKKVSQLTWLVLLSFFISAGAQAAFYLSKASETTYDDSPALIIRFTDALDERIDLDEYIEVTPAVENGSRWITLDGGYSWTLPFVEPNTEYQIEVSDYPVSMSGEAFERVFIEDSSSGRQYSDDWTVQTRPINPSASFAQNGQYLTTQSPEALPVTVVNLDAVALDIFRVRDDQLDSFLRNTFFSGRQYYNKLNQLKAWADLVHTAQFEPGIRRHQRATINLDIGAALEKHDHGVYVAVLRKPGTYEYRYDSLFFTQSDIGIHTRLLKEETQTLVHSLENGEPIAGAEVFYYWDANNSQNRRLVERRGISDVDGQFVLKTNKTPVLVLARWNDQISFLRLQQNRLDLSAYPNVSTLHQSLQGFFWGPRDLYRPGETVDISMLLRDHDGQSVSNVPIRAAILNARGSRVERFTWRADGNTGRYHHQITLPENAPTGQWKLVIENNTPFNGEYVFNVEEFLPERIELTFFDGEKQDYHYLESRTGAVTFNAQYLYGAPAAGNRADAIVTVSAATDLFEQWDDYRFGDPTESIQRKTKKLNQIRLDEEGNGRFEMPSDYSNIDTPIKYRVTASVYEEGGRPVTRSETVIAVGNTGKTLVGADPAFDDRAQSNQPARFSLIAVDGEGVAVADDINVRLIRKTRDYYWFFDDANGWSWRWRGDSYVAWTKNLSISEEGMDIDLPVQWGDYELHLESSDGVKTVVPFRTQYYWSQQQAGSLKPEVIDMVLDKDHYAPGEQVLITLNSPVAGQALLQVESSEAILYSEQFMLSPGDESIPLNVDSSWNRHDLYITLMVISPADMVTETAPTRALGISHLPILRSDAVLDVEVNVPDKIEPNRTVTAEVKVLNPEVADGERLFATVAMVDQGVLNITNFKRPQPEAFWFAPRRFEGQYMDMYGRILNNLGLTQVSQKFGGGFADSDDSLSRGGDKPKSEVQIISEFSDPVELINGEGTVSFDLPSFNGRVKWMVVVWSASSYGSAEARTTIADRLVTQLSAPRFLAMGDQSQLTLDLHNLSGEPQRFDVSLTVDGAIQAGNVPDEISLDDKEKQSLLVPIEAVDFSGQGLIRLTVSNGSDISVQREWKLGVRAPFPLRTLTAKTTIDAGTSWKPEPVVEHLIPETIQAQLTISDRPAIAFSSHVDYLLRYPYGCLEQTLSSTYPWIHIDQSVFDELSLASSFERRFGEPYSDALRRKQIEAGIVRLMTKQKSDGSFGYWNANSGVSMWGTSYAVELLQDAQKLGVSIDTSRFNRATDAIQKMLRGSTTSDIWTEDANAYTYSYRAYAAYVLSRSGLASLSDLRRLFDQMERGNANHSPLPWMHLAVALDSAGDQARSEQAMNRALSTNRVRNRYYADYGSSVRDIALSLSLALEHDFDTGRLTEDLEAAMADRRWLSTQERISLVKVARAFFENGSDWQGEIVTTDFSQSLDRDQPFNTLLSGEQLSTIQAITASDKKLYANLLWQGVPSKAPEPYQLGMTISREYYDLDGNRVTFDSPVNSGDLFVARINVQGLERRYPEALVVDLLPAGFELENQNLLNASVNLDELEIDGNNVGEFFRSYRVDFQEYRDDRYVSAVSLTSWSPTTLFYLVRAVTPGEYALPNAYVEDMYRPYYQAMSYTPGKVTVLPIQ